MLPQFCISYLHMFTYVNVHTIDYEMQRSDTAPVNPKGRKQLSVQNFRLGYI